jgi:integrase
MPKISNTTHALLENTLIIYQRERSNVWQCRFKVDGLWQRASTKQHDLIKAKDAAKRLMIEAEIRKQSNLPVITRRFKDVAKLAIERMNKDMANGRGKVSYIDYIRCINDYLIPCFSKRSITHIDYAALDELDNWRTEHMGKAASHSTLLTHNAALNRVFDEAIIRNFLTEVNRPKLEAKGRKGQRHAAFELHEIRALLSNFESWFDRARTKDSRELRMLLRDYVEVLLNTGARPGVELMNLKWRQIKFNFKPTVTKTTEINKEDGEPIVTHDLNRSCEMIVTGKTGERKTLGMQSTVAALRRIAERNYGITGDVLNPLKELTVTSNEDYVFRTKAGKKPTSFQKLFRHYLIEHNLLIDPLTEKERVFYSLRHTYATLALVNDKVPIHTLAKQMGTSVLMIEKHYSHLKVTQAIEQLRGKETQRLINAMGEIDESYSSNRV